MLELLHRIITNGKTIVALSALIAFASGVTKAQDEDLVSLYFFSDQEIEFDLQKVANKSASALSENGIAVTSVKRLASIDPVALSAEFENGESAKLLAKVIPGAVIEGSPLSSYPVTISIDVIGVESSVAIKSIKKIARSQHTLSLIHI